MTRNVKRNVLGERSERLNQGQSWQNSKEQESKWTFGGEGGPGKPEQVSEAKSSDEVFDFSRGQDRYPHHDDHKNKGGNTGLSVLIGLAGGLAATYVMTQAQTAVQKAQKSAQAKKPKSKEEQQKEVREQSTVKIADKVSRSVTNHEVPQEQKQTAGNTVHYAFGTLMGGVYGGLASFLDDAPLGTGLLFGIGLWLAADEFLLPYLGLSKPPQQRDLKEHAYEASAHAVYGLTLDAVNQLRKRVA